MGFRFSKLQIPRNATITEAYLRFTSKSDRTGAAEFTVRSEDTANAEPFTAANNSVTSRQWNTPGVTWVPGDWSTNVAIESDNIGEVLQQVVDRGDWCSGNAMSFNITGTGQEREAYSVESSDPAANINPAQLIVRYDESTAIDMSDCGQETLEVRISQGSDDAEQFAEDSVYAGGQSRGSSC